MGSMIPGHIQPGFEVLGNVGSPLNKAIELIDGLKEKVEADGVKQQEAYKKYKDTKKKRKLMPVLQG